MSKEDVPSNIHGNESNLSPSSIKEKKDKLREFLEKRLKKEPDEFFKAVYPLIKLTAAGNLLNEVQSVSLNEEYKDKRKKKFQILRALLNLPDFGKMFIKASTAMTEKQTDNWRDHSPLAEYLENEEKRGEMKYVEGKYNGHLLMEFLRILRNHHQHTFQVGDYFRDKILKTKRISNAAYCDFVENRFPSLIAFLTWLYVGACDAEDEIIIMLGKDYGEGKLNILEEDQLINFIEGISDFFFGEGRISPDELRVVVKKAVEFDDVFETFTKPIIPDPNPNR